MLGMSSINKSRFLVEGADEGPADASLNARLGRLFPRIKKCSSFRERESRSLSTCYFHIQCFPNRRTSVPSMKESESPSFQSSRPFFHSTISMSDDAATARTVAVLPTPDGPVRARILYRLMMND